jgi:hypothetical protein
MGIRIYTNEVKCTYDKNSRPIYFERWEKEVYNSKWTRISKERFDYIVKTFSGNPTEIIVAEDGICNYLKYTYEGSDYAEEKQDEPYPDQVNYNFKINGRTGVYNVTFKIKKGKMITTCDCKAGQEDMLCWHRSYILSGNEKLLINNNRELQLKLIKEAFNTRGGNNMVRYANHRFSYEKYQSDPIKKTSVKPELFKWVKVLILIPLLIVMILIVILFVIAG